jgi:hypothetical protein
MNILRTTTLFTALLTLLFALVYAQPAGAAMLNIPLSANASTVLNSAGVCKVQPAPVNGVPQWPVYYYTANRKSTRAAGLLVIQQGNYNGTFIELARHSTSTWSNNNALMAANLVGERVLLYVMISVPKVGRVAYPVNSRAIAIPFC